MLFLGADSILHRTLTLPLRRAALSGFPILVQGPRGAGKTTLLRHTFPAHSYVTMEDAADRSFARRDPRAFLGRLRGPTLLDDVHRVPELLRELNQPRPLILGSSIRLQTELETFELYPPTRAELEGRPPLPLEMLGRFAPAPTPSPRALAQLFQPDHTWLDRDIPSLIRVHDRDLFETFAATVEARSGAILDQQALAKECGIAHRTAARWLAAMETCFRLLRLPPSPVDFGRRLLRSPKLHVYGSADIQSRAVTGIYANARHSGLTPDLSYWRDSNGFEIPLIVQTETAPPMPVMIAAEPGPPDIARLRRWMDLARVTQGAAITERPSNLPRPGILHYPLASL